ncbi:DNA repair protein RecN [Peptoniphilus sp. KCTC 25270]|uniref:DNA repair protein RecN n=1 Tax=Peptoniphilus sp. KCTC 25270 TaxID=2897414 RepID=UPI001E3D2E82|nr:DNA repair protein RecN [Peptoniphilus sp. KCTC 25270]MCD1147144.1 DNA repair protein RecN [Peptoniphilus sp. KCTC 25270]
MLLSLNIENFAIIDRTNVEFSSGFNVLTGETGAGKSIIMDAIGLILGARAQKAMIRDGSDSAHVEAVFQTNNSYVKQLLEENGIQEDEVLILNRSISLDRPSICRINGRTVPNSVLTEVGNALADSTYQQQNQSLLNGKAQMEFLDQYIGTEHLENLKNLKEKVANYRQIEKFIQEENSDEASRVREMELLRYQMDEIEELALQEGELEELEKEGKRLKNSTKVQESLFSMDSLVNQERGIRELWDRYSSEIASIESLDEGYEALSKRVESIGYELMEIFSEGRYFLESMDFNEERLYQVENRLNSIYTAMRKYGNGYDKITDYYQEVSERFAFLESFEEKMEEQKREAQLRYKEAMEMAKIIHETREKASGQLEEKMVRELQELNIPHGKFSIHLDEIPMNEQGIDKVVYYISTNKGEKLYPLTEIASGGEMSRILLAFKSIMADVDRTETLIFDEIDIGMSGKTAKIVGEKMKKLSRTHQLLVISHLPQVVSRAKEQYQIKKQLEGGRTTSHIIKLSEEERIESIATMISGESNKETRETARNMLKDSYSNNRGE